MLEQVIAESQQAAEAGEPVHPAPAAEAQYRLGLLEAERMIEVRLDCSPAELRRQVEKLGDIFSAAFQRLAAALWGGSPFWAVEAGDRIGALYLEVHTMFFDAPVPPALGGNERDAYLSLLRARTRILLANALEAWEENLVRAERTGVRSEAVERTAEGIARVEEILDARAENRTEMDQMAEDFLEAQGESDPLAPLLERLGLEPGRDEEEQGPPAPVPEAPAVPEVEPVGEGAAGAVAAPAPAVGTSPEAPPAP